MGKVKKFFQKFKKVIIGIASGFVAIVAVIGVIFWKVINKKQDDLPDNKNIKIKKEDLDEGKDIGITDSDVDAWYDKFLRKRKNTNNK